LSIWRISGADPDPGSGAGHRRHFRRGAGDTRNIPITIGDIAAVRGAGLRCGDARLWAVRACCCRWPASMAPIPGDHPCGGSGAGADDPALAAQGIRVYPGLHRPANFVERAVHSLTQSPAIAGVLILLVLYLFCATGDRR
jgi:hypothetical protein